MHASCGVRASGRCRTWRRHSSQRTPWDGEPCARSCGTRQYSSAGGAPTHVVGRARSAVRPGCRTRAGARGSPRRRHVRGSRPRTRPPGGGRGRRTRGPSVRRAPSQAGATRDPATHFSAVPRHCAGTHPPSAIIPSVSTSACSASSVPTRHSPPTEMITPIDDGAAGSPAGSHPRHVRVEPGDLERVVHGVDRQRTADEGGEGLLRGQRAAARPRPGRRRSARTAAGTRRSAPSPPRRRTGRSRPASPGPRRSGRPRSASRTRRVPGGRGTGAAGTARGEECDGDDRDQGGARAVEHARQARSGRHRLSARSSRSSPDRDPAVSDPRRSVESFCRDEGAHREALVDDRSRGRAAGSGRVVGGGVAAGGSPHRGHPVHVVIGDSLPAGQQSVPPAVDFPTTAALWKANGFVAQYHRVLRDELACSPGRPHHPAGRAATPSSW